MLGKFSLRNLMPKRSQEQKDRHQIELYKQAWKETIDEYVQKFGWFSISTLAVLLLGTLIYIILVHQGWTAPSHLPSVAVHEYKK